MSGNAMERQTNVGCISKTERAKLAIENTEKMAAKYEQEIEIAVQKTKVYDDEVFVPEVKGGLNTTGAKIIVEDIDSVGAAVKYGSPDSAVLNFASYKNPGGGFICGSKAQEECLCHESFLYNVLEEFQSDYYAWNTKHKNRALYLNRGLFSPDIQFFRDGRAVKCSVITCAAPNKSAAQRYQCVSDKENTKVLRSRIQFVLNIAKDNKVGTLILGAYGCGVFGQNPEEVAKIFKELLEGEYSDCFNVVIFAIPRGKDGNLDVFRKVFGG